MTFQRGRAFWLAAAVLLLVMLAPLVATLLAVSPAQAVAAFSALTARSALAVSLAASVLSITAASILGVPAGFALANAGRTLRNAVIAILALPLAFPPVASGIMLLELLGRQTPFGAFAAAHGIVFVDSLAGVALAQFFVAGSFVAITSAAAFAAVDPVLQEAARTLGAGTMRVFVKILLPLAAPGVAAGIMLAWMRAIGEYGATSILAYHPTSLPVLLYVTLSASGVDAALALTYGFVVLGIVLFAAQWAFARRVV